MADTKVALVTGAARGLGLEIARVLGRDGFRLFLLDVLDERLAEAAQALEAEGYTVATRKTDVSRHDEAFAAVAQCIAAFGRLDVLVNCAGIVRFNHAHEVPQAEWDRILGVNLSGPFFMTQAALPHLIAAEGNIVNIASSNGLRGTPYTLPYAATKAALISMTKTLAMEYVDAPIRVNAVCPGPMNTEIGNDIVFPPNMDEAKLARYAGQRPAAEASEVAQAVGFMASSAASAVHGAIWTADGGISAG